MNWAGAGGGLGTGRRDSAATGRRWPVTTWGGQRWSRWVGVRLGGTKTQGRERPGFWYWLFRLQYNRCQFILDLSFILLSSSWARGQPGAGRRMTRAVTVLGRGGGASQDPREWRLRKNRVDGEREKMDIFCARLGGCVLSLVESPKPRDSPAREGLAPFYHGNRGLESLMFLCIYISLPDTPSRKYVLGCLVPRGEQSFPWARKFSWTIANLCFWVLSPLSPSPGPPGPASLSLRLRIPGSWRVETSSCVRICKSVWESLREWATQIENLESSKLL